MPSVFEHRTQHWAAGVRSHRTWSGAWSSEKRNRDRPSSCILTHARAQIQPAWPYFCLSSRCLLSTLWGALCTATRPLPVYFWLEHKWARPDPQRGQQFQHRGGESKQRRGRRAKVQAMRKKIKDCERGWALKREVSLTSCLVKNLPFITNGNTLISAFLIKAPSFPLFLTPAVTSVAVIRWALTWLVRRPRLNFLNNFIKDFQFYGPTWEICIAPMKKIKQRRDTVCRVRLDKNTARDNLKVCLNINKR